MTVLCCKPVVFHPQGDDSTNFDFEHINVAARNPAVVQAMSAELHKLVAATRQPWPGDK